MCHQKHWHQSGVLPSPPSVVKTLVFATARATRDSSDRSEDAEGRRRAEQKLHEHVLAQMDLPESADVQVASQPRTTFPVRPPSMNTMQHAEVLKNAFSACEIDLEAAVASCDVIFMIIISIKVQ